MTEDGFQEDPQSRSEETKWSGANISEYPFEKEQDPTKRLEMMRETLGTKLNPLAPQLLDYVQGKRYKHNSPDAAITVKIANPQQSEAYDLALWTMDNKVKTLYTIDDNGIIITSESLPYADLPPGDLLSLGIRSEGDTNPHTEALAITNGRETVISAAANNKMALGRIIIGIDGMPAILAKQSTPQSEE